MLRENTLLLEFEKQESVGYRVVTIYLYLARKALLNICRSLKYHALSLIYKVFASTSGEFSVLMPQELTCHGTLLRAPAHRDPKATHGICERNLCNSLD
jgi:hypothetical protein